MANIEGELADFALAEYDANPQFIEGLIAKGETTAKQFLVGVFSNIKVGGIAGIILPAVEGGVEKFVNAYFASHTPQAIYVEIRTILANEAKVLGG